MRYRVKLFARLKEHTGLADWELEAEGPLRGSQFTGRVFLRISTGWMACAG